MGLRAADEHPFSLFNRGSRQSGAEPDDGDAVEARHDNGFCRKRGDEDRSRRLGGAPAVTRFFTFTCLACGTDRLYRLSLS